MSIYIDHNNELTNKPLNLCLAERAVIPVMPAPFVVIKEASEKEEKYMMILKYLG